MFSTDAEHAAISFNKEIPGVTKVTPGILFLLIRVCILPQPSYPFGNRDCHVQASRHISATLRSARQPSSASARDGSA